MSVVAVLSVLFDAKTDKLEKGLDRAAKSAKGLDAGFGGFDAGGLAISGMSLAAGAGAIALEALAAAAEFAIDQIGDAFGRMNELAKATHKLGIGADELGAMQYAAEQAGVETDRLTGIVSKFQKTMADAAAGGPQNKAFAELGLDAKAMMALPIDEQFGRIADAMQNVSTHAEKVRLAVALFGEAGTDALALLEDGAGGVAEKFKEFHGLNAALSQQEVEQVASMNDAWNRLTAAIDGVWNHIAAALAPALEAVLRIAGDLVATFSIFFEQSLGGWQTITKAAGWLLDLLANIGRATAEVGQMFVNMTHRIMESFASMLEGASSIAKKLSGDRLGFDGMANAIRSAAAEVKKLDNALNVITNRPRDSMSKFMADLQKASRAAGEKLNRQAGGFEAPEFHSAMESGRMAAPGALEFGSREAFSAINAAGGDAGTMVDQQKLTVKGIQSMTERLIEQRQELMRIGRWIEGLGQNAKQVKL